MTQDEVYDAVTLDLHRIDAAEDALHSTVARLRNGGVTWVQIANALNVTPQAVQQRFGR